MMRGGITPLVYLLAVLFIAGCSGDKKDLNRVQPAYVTKTDFLNNSWYYRRTIVDSPEDSSWATIGTGDLFTLERIRWEIQENQLVAYRDYEFVPGAETNPGEDNSDYQGAPLAAFAITSHFDITREYNSATLEETNVINENTTDRPWYERSYMRVDWSTNTNPELRQIIPVEVDNNLGQGAFFVHENDAANPYHARIAPQEGYIDFVVNHFVYPDYDACSAAFDYFAGCAPGEVKVRHAFSRVNQEREARYQPLWYPDNVAVKDASGKEITDPKTGEIRREPIFQRFGYYRIERPTYDDKRGLTESGRMDRILRFDIWDKYIDAEGREIPYNQRQVQPIVYHLNWDFPEELKAAAFDVAAQWNNTFKQTVASLQQRDISAIPDVFKLYENNCSQKNLEKYYAANKGVQAQVEAYVGKPLSKDTLVNFCSSTEYVSRNFPMEKRFVWQQNGDPRFSMMYYINNITPSGFAGYGPMFGDPVSGRIVSASAYIMGWTIEDAATKALEYIDYINGEISIDDILKGTYLPSMYEGGDLDPLKFLRTVDDVQIQAQKSASNTHLQSLENRFARYGNAPQAFLKPLENSDYYADRLARIEGTPFEREWLLRPEDLIVSSHGEYKPGMNASADLYKEASLAKRYRDNAEHSGKSQRFLEQNTFCPMAEFDGALLGLAKEYKSLPREERRARLKQSIFKAVLLHEVGHNVGLRHNFEGSYDALNYPNKFWELENSGLSEQGKLEMRQPEYKYSSIMDYHGRINADFQGLGKYDTAAIKFGYGQLIETFADKFQPASKTLKDWLFVNDYHKIPAQVLNNANRIDVRFDWTKPNLTADDVEQATKHEVPYMFCSDEYAGYTPTCRRFDFGSNQREVMQASYTKYKNYFIFTNFLRNRLAPDWNATMRGYSAFHDILTTYQYMYLYRSKQQEMFGNNAFFSTDLGRDMATAVADGLNMMAEVLATPEPGRYYACRYSNKDVYFSQEDLENGILDTSLCDMSDQETILSVGDAEPLFLDFTEDYIAWTFRYIGTYWDKTAAIQELTNPYVTFFRVNGQEDRRAYSVSLYRIYDREILDMMSDLIQYKRSSLGSFLNTDTKRLVPKSMVDSNQSLDVNSDSAENLPVVWPSLARNLQRMGVLYGLAFLSSPLDDAMDFEKHTRVTLKGSYDDVAVAGASDLRMAECTLPTTGYTYRAQESRNGYSISYDMVKDCEYYAKAYLTATTPVDRQNALDSLALIEQTLQYNRLIHLIYEHGAEL